MVEEVVNLSSEDLEQDYYKKGGVNVVYDGFEVILIFGFLDKICSMIDERVFGCGGDDSIGFVVFVISCVVNQVFQVFVYSERFFSDGRLISCDERNGVIIVDRYNIRVLV